MRSVCVHGQIQQRCLLVSHAAGWKEGQGVTYQAADWAKKQPPPVSLVCTHDDNNVTTCARSCAEAELAAGQQGSKALRSAALGALHALVDAAASSRAGPDSIAYFVPGLATGLSKALLAAGQSHGPRGGTGAAASSGAAVHALAALVDVLCLALGDASTRPLLQQQPQQQGGGGGGPGDAQQALAQLQALAAKARAGNAGSAGEATQGGKQQPTVAAAPAAGSQAFRRGSQFRVERSAAWAVATSGRVAAMLPQVLPPLAAYPRPAVRVALVTGAPVFVLTHLKEILIYLFDMRFLGYSQG